jgi:hypothetical protein
LQTFSGARAAVNLRGARIMLGSSRQGKPSALQPATDSAGMATT